MVEKRKSEKSRMSNSDEERDLSEQSADVGGLTASLDALKKIADKGEKRIENDLAKQSGMKEKEPEHSVGSVKNLVDELDEKYAMAQESRGSEAAKQAKSNKPEKTKSNKKTKRNKKEKKSEDLGVVDLLGALKSDIDSLRKENEEFKA